MVELETIMEEKNVLREITVLPENRKIYVPDGANLLEALRENDFDISNPCSGAGVCGKCFVMITDGGIPPGEKDKSLLSKEQIDKNYRLSCDIKVEKDITLFIEPQSETIPAKELMSSAPSVTLASGIQKNYLILPHPSSDDQRADTQRIQDGLGQKLSFPLGVLPKIPRILRNNDFKVTLTLNGDVSVVDVEPGDKVEHSYGIAIDIGTTTVVVYLYSLFTGKEIMAKSITNPQSMFGADVITRINYIHKNGERGLKELQDRILQGLNSVIEEICQDKELLPLNIYKACIAGNPTMIQLFMGIDPCYLDKAPYIPVLRDTMSFKALSLGLKINPEALIQILPSVSAYIGSDITAGILATDMDKAEGLKLLIDIGTNGEIVLGNKERMVACSAAAGPAFEGANIERGMRAQLGAIHTVNMDEENIKFEVFGDGPSLGVCGSGLIDLVAQLRKLDLLSSSGKFHTRSSLSLSSRFKKLNKQKCFSIDGDIYISQKDIRELQLAKGAMRAGIELLLRELDIKIEDVEEIYLAGSFGNFLKKESVKAIGLVPDVSLDKIKSVGDTAGQGVKLCLLNHHKLRRVQKIAEKVNYLELSYRAEFNDEFIKQMSFPLSETEKSQD